MFCKSTTFFPSGFAISGPHALRGFTWHEATHVRETVGIFQAMAPLEFPRTLRTECSSFSANMYGTWIEHGTCMENQDVKRF